ncbi:cytochrome P450 [Lactarius akahatsu]|uniref:Cytochrome P450 n=1 Tax=Lactarius akahatsu TaxID=416441 RepID=A0AAD4LEP0_9AGAM|nr:cytochrome P450 [Lactarius akahatsu]
MVTTQLPEIIGFGDGSDSDRKACLLATFLLLAGGLIARLAQSYIRNLPPGPRGLPLIGDVIHIANPEWLASPKRKDEYGDMMYINALGTGMLIINSQRVAVDLLEKRSTIYSSRPHYISVGDFMTQNLAFGIVPYGDRLRQFRRVTAEIYSKSTNPSAPERHFHRHAWSIMLSVNYDLPPLESEDDPCLVEIEDHLRRFMREIQPGTRLVEYFPWLKYVPDRFAKWKRDTQNWFIQDSLMFQRFLGKVKDDLANGIDRPSFAATVIKSQSKHGLSEVEKAWLVGHLLAAGGDTTSSGLEWWLLAMLMYPNVQARAHAELDEVVGRDRPPTFADIPFLPYIRAMVKETLRWSPIAPFSVPHASTADDWYEGTFIPKGTICLQNMGVLNFDREVFGDNVAEFDPTRYLDEKGRVKMQMGGREEGHMTFGFGRRVCPGRYVAEGTISIDIATLLWAMRFERPEGSQGELGVRNRVQSGLTAHPVPFECKVVPRFTEAEALLNEGLSMYK